MGARAGGAVHQLPPWTGVAAEGAGGYGPGGDGGGGMETRA